MTCGQCWIRSRRADHEGGCRARRPRRQQRRDRLRRALRARAPAHVPRLGRVLGSAGRPVRGVRKATAAAMVSSAFTAPHVTMFLTVDVTPMMELRARLQRTTAVPGREADPAGVRRPGGMPRGPADPGGQRQLGRGDRRDRLLRLRASRHRCRHPARTGGAQDPQRRPDAAARACRRAGRAGGIRPGGTHRPGDMLGGTITITNIGVFGIDTGTPILNPGESAILALGTIRDMPWVVDGCRGGAQGLPASAVRRPPRGRRPTRLPVPHPTSAPSSPTPPKPSPSDSRFSAFSGLSGVIRTSFSPLSPLNTVSRRVRLGMVGGVWISRS